MMSTDTPSLANTIADAYSLEVSVKDVGALTKAAPRMLPGSTMFIPYLPGQTTLRGWPQHRWCAGLASNPCRIFLHAA